jgi:hypothetical protein
MIRGATGAEQAREQAPGWGIPAGVQRLLARTVGELRTQLEADFRIQLTALGIGPSGVAPLTRTLPPDEQRARDVVAAVVEQAVAAGATPGEAVEQYIAAAAYTFLNRAFGLRCLEERGLLLVDGRPETVFRRDPELQSSTLYWQVKNERPAGTAPRELWRETLRRALTAVTQRVRSLFDPDDEHAVLLPRPAALQAVEAALNRPEVPPETYAQDEVLGWVYMYYRAAEKDAVYARLAKGKKLERPDEFAAASYLYTERYMVDYLLQNTLGRLWLDLHPDSRLPAQWPYFVRPPASAEGAAASSNPAAEGGQTANTPNPDAAPPSSPSTAGSPLSPSIGGKGTGDRGLVRGLTLLDPACGSGHFLVRAFDLFAAMYAEEGIEDPAEVPALILERNLHGIDIDPRAVQIAALGLYLKGCALAGPAFRPRRLNLLSADAVLPGATPPAPYMAQFAGDPEAAALVTGIWQGLRDVRTLGSLLYPERALDALLERRRARDRGSFFEQDEAEQGAWKEAVLEGLREQFELQSRSEDLGQRLFGEQAAKGVGLVEALGRRYDVVVANPPYAGGGNLSPSMKQFLEREYKDGKRDLYAAFILRCRDYCRPGGYVGMVTQQSWMFQSSYAGLRSRVLGNDALLNVAHLGRYAFEENSAGGGYIRVVLFALKRDESATENVTAFRLTAPHSSVTKAVLLTKANQDECHDARHSVSQSTLAGIPGSPLAYWLRPRFFELLQSKRRLRDIADVKQGLSTADSDRFTRFIWEVSSITNSNDTGHTPEGWSIYVKGGGYQKWSGMESMVVAWKDNGHAIRSFPKAYIRNEDFYFRTGLTYSVVCSGSMGVRTMRESIFSNTSDAIIPARISELYCLLSILSSRVVSFNLRVTTQDTKFESGYVADTPLPQRDFRPLDGVGSAAVALKSLLLSGNQLERVFTGSYWRLGNCRSVGEWIEAATASRDAVAAWLHTLEGYNERVVCDAYGLDSGDVQAVVDETGAPAGWYPLVAGFDALPETPEGVDLPEGLGEFLAGLPRLTPSPAELAKLKARLRVLYQAGPGGNVAEEAADEEAGAGTEDGEDEGAALGARIPIPTETFLEELSQKLEIHPISVYRLLEELREQEGLVSPPELKRQLEDYASVSVLRLLGYRWPEQDAYEAEHGSILDPELVKQDGILPLVDCGDGDTLEARLRRRLERQFGEQGAERSLAEFRQYVGRELGDWLRRDFFKRHVQQFKQRPIAWHLTSPEGTFQAMLLYHRLSRGTLQALRTRYAGRLIERLRAEQDRARSRNDAAEAARLQGRIEDVEEFSRELQAIERGDELRHRVRCRWKGEEVEGRPGPYAPDIDDGVKVNIRPFQESGLLAMRQVIKKW